MKTVKISLTKMKMNNWKYITFSVFSVVVAFACFINSKISKHLFDVNNPDFQYLPSRYGFHDLMEQYTSSHVNLFLP